MSDKHTKKSISAVVGTAFAASIAVAPIAVNADENPFSITELSNGYNVASHHESGEKNNESSCGADKGSDGSCGGEKSTDGSCGGEKSTDGRCGGANSCGGEFEKKKVDDSK